MKCTITLMSLVAILLTQACAANRNNPNPEIAPDEAAAPENEEQPLPSVAEQTSTTQCPPEDDPTILQMKSAIERIVRTMPFSAWYDEWTRLEGYSGLTAECWLRYMAAFLRPMPLAEYMVDRFRGNGGLSTLIDYFNVLYGRSYSGGSAQQVFEHLNAQFGPSHAIRILRQKGGHTFSLLGALTISYTQEFDEAMAILATSGIVPGFVPTDPTTYNQQVREFAEGWSQDWKQSLPIYASRVLGGTTTAEEWRWALGVLGIDPNADAITILRGMIQNGISMRQANQALTALGKNDLTPQMREELARMTGDDKAFIRLVLEANGDPYPAILAYRANFRSQIPDLSRAAKAIGVVYAEMNPPQRFYDLAGAIGSFPSGSEDRKKKKEAEWALVAFLNGYISGLASDRGPVDLALNFLKEAGWGEDPAIDLLVRYQFGGHSKKEIEQAAFLLQGEASGSLSHDQ